MDSLYPTIFILVYDAERDFYFIVSSTFSMYFYGQNLTDA